MSALFPFDESVRKSAQRHRAVYEAFPKSKCAQAYRVIANALNGWPLPVDPCGHLESFGERLLQKSAEVRDSRSDQPERV